jgi:uncharacterized protein YkwD
LEVFRFRALLVHNYYRSKHHTPSLVSDEYLTNSAQTWAEKLAKNDTNDRKINETYGQNFYLIKLKYSKVDLTTYFCAGNKMKLDYYLFYIK